MRLADITSKVCGDLIVEVDEGFGRPTAITSFLYPNNDSVNLYFDDLGDGSFFVSDEGATLAFFHHADVELTAERIAIIKRVSKRYELEFARPVLRKRFAVADAGAACLSFCEAITRISSIYFHAPAQTRSKLPVAIRQLLLERVKPSREFESNWVDKRRDPKAAYPVDYHFNGVGRPRNLFTVTSSGKSLLVAATTNFYRSKGDATPALAVIDHGLNLGARSLVRLQQAVTEIRFGLDGHEDDIVRFALES